MGLEKIFNSKGLDCLHCSGSSIIENRIMIQKIKRDNNYFVYKTFIILLSYSYSYPTRHTTTTMTTTTIINNDNKKLYLFQGY